MSWLAACIGMEAMSGAASQHEVGRGTAWAIAACVQGNNTNAQTNAQMRGNVRKDGMDSGRGKGVNKRRKPGGSILAKRSGLSIGG